MTICPIYIAVVQLQKMFAPREESVSFIRAIRAASSVEARRKLIQEFGEHQGDEGFVLETSAPIFVIELKYELARDWVFEHEFPNYFDPLMAIR